MIQANWRRYISKDIIRKLILKIQWDKEKQEIINSFNKRKDKKLIQNIKIIKGCQWDVQQTPIGVMIR